MRRARLQHPRRSVSVSIDPFVFYALEAFAGARELSLSEAAELVLRQYLAMTDQDDVQDCLAMPNPIQLSKREMRQQDRLREEEALRGPHN